MENILYEKLLTPASEAPDGETPTKIYVTNEANGWAVWRSSFDEGTILIGYSLWSRDRAIEYAVLHASRKSDYSWLL